jgi:hypothetical protein
LVSWSATANTATTPRSGTLNIAGLTFTVVQAGAGCTYAIAPGYVSAGSSAASGAITVTADSGCNWTASSSSPTWLTCTPSSGNGSGIVTWSVTANGSCTFRSSMLTVAGKTFAVNQQGAAGIFSILPGSASIAAGGGTGSVTVTGGSDCTWTASSGASWITVSAGGTGSGTASYSVQPNTSSSTRSATLTIAGKSFLVTQAASVDSVPPTVALTAPTSGSTVSGTVNLIASASDNVGVTRVDFYCNNSVLLGTATASPWTVACNTTILPNGTHSFYCKAQDGAGNSATSVAISATVNNGTSTPGQLLWVATPGSEGIDRGQAVTTDLSGNVIMAGKMNGFFVVHKYNPAGQSLWSKEFGCFGVYGNANGVVTDSAGNIFVAGCYSASFSQAIDCGGFTLPAGSGATDIFVVKLSPSGDPLWSKGISGSGDDQAKGVAVDGSGDVYVTGAFTGSANFGSSTSPVLLSNAGGTGSDIFLAKLSGQSGVTAWAKRFGVVDSFANAEFGSAVAVNGYGEVFVTGACMGPIDFGGGTLFTAGGCDIFVAQFSTSGVYRWAKTFGASQGDGGNGIAVTPEGDAVLTGYFQGAMTLPGTSINLSTAVTDQDVFLAKFLRTGSCAWARSFTGSLILSYAPEVGDAVSVGRDGSIVFSGRISGAVNFGGGTVAANATDAFIAKLNANGGYVWAKTFGGSGGDEALGVSVSPDGKVFATGYWSGSVNFGDGTTRVSTLNDAFILGLAP